MKERQYYNQSIEEVIKEFDVDTKTGLKDDDLKTREGEYGKNELDTQKKNSPIIIFIKQFLDPITILLLAASLLSVFLGDYIDSLIIFAIVFLSSLLSFWQEYNADKAMEDLTSLIKSKITVRRDGKNEEIETSDVLPGDILILQAGDIIPADGRFIKSNNLSVNESSLTGESFSVDKNTDVLNDDTALSKRSNMGFMGSNVVSGTGELLVTNIGRDTYFGQVAKDISVASPTTEFKQGLNKFGKLLMSISGIMILIIFTLNLVMKKPIYDSMMFAISLAVGITPQLLPAISSVNLSIGAKKMADKDVIIRQLQVIDNISGMDVLCSDKTGTITEGSVSVDGAYDLNKEKSQLLLDLAVDNSYYSSSKNNDIDKALMKDIKEKDMDDTFVSEKSYNFIDKVSSVAIKFDDKKILDSNNLIIMKGAIKNVLNFCDRALLPDGSIESLSSQKDKIDDVSDKLSSEGYRCLGIAVKSFEEDVKFNENMIFAGFITLFDPLKDDSLEVIDKLNDLDVDLKIITGDSILVAKYLAGELNIDPNYVISYTDFDNLSDDEKSKKVEEIKIFAEVEPEGKKDIIKFLKSNDHLVGYIGDGINDVPSLHEADVAISVNNATDVAKDAANIVLLKSNLNVVIDAIKEGRKVFANTMKYIFIAISANFGNMFSMAGASLMLKFLPLLPKQILMTNLLQDLPSMALATDNVDDRWIKTPHRFNFKFIVSFMITFGLISSIFDYMMFGILLLKLNANDSLFQTARFSESVISAVILMLILRTSKPFYKFKPSNRLLFSAIGIIIFTAILSYLPFSHLLGFTPLPLTIWPYIIGVILIYMATGEIAKRIFYKYHTI